MSTLGSDIVAVTCIVLGGAVGTAGLSALLAEGDDAREEGVCGSLVLTTAEAPRVVIRVDGENDVAVVPTVRITSVAPVVTGVPLDCVDQVSETRVRVRAAEARASAAELRARAEEARARAEQARARAEEARVRADAERREVLELMDRVREQRQELRDGRNPDRGRNR